MTSGGETPAAASNALVAPSIVAAKTTKNASAANRRFATLTDFNVVGSRLTKGEMQMATTISNNSSATQNLALRPM